MGAIEVSRAAAWLLQRALRRALMALYVNRIQNGGDRSDQYCQKTLTRRFSSGVHLTKTF